jgi:hypothetical protein
MAQFTNTTFEGGNIDLDGNAFEGCTFKKCTLIYRAIGGVQITGSNFDECTFAFDGPAGLTIEFLKFLYHGFDIGPELVEKLIDDLIKAPPEQPVITAQESAQ